MLSLLLLFFRALFHSFTFGCQWLFFVACPPFLSRSSPHLRLREWLLFILAYNFQKMVFRLHIQHTIKSFCLFWQLHTDDTTRAYNVKQIINLTGKLFRVVRFFASECIKCLFHRNHLMISASESKCNFCTVIYPKFLASFTLCLSPPGLYLPLCLFTVALFLNYALSLAVCMLFLFIWSVFCHFIL